LVEGLPASEWIWVVSIMGTVRVRYCGSACLEKRGKDMTDDDRDMTDDDRRPETKCQVLE
jgi:hypothetical protein